MRSIPFVATALVAAYLVPVHVVQGEDVRTSGASSRELGEDPSCDFVNRSYVNTAAGNFAVTIYGVEPTGSIKLLDSSKYIGRAAYDRQGLGSWHLRYRDYQKTVDGIGAVFRNCAGPFDRTYGGIPVKIYRVDWARNGYNAKSEVIISAGTSKFIKVTRHFTKQSPLGSPVMIDVFETDREKIEAPSDAIDLRDD